MGKVVIVEFCNNEGCKYCVNGECVICPTISKKGVCKSSTSVGKFLVTNDMIAEELCSE